MSASVHIDRSRLQRLLGPSPGSPGGRLLLRKAERVAALARRYAQGHGTIPQGIIVEPYSKGYKVVSTNKHSKLVLLGSRPHKIRPKNAKVLRFQVDGQTVFARVVNHPGYKGDPFLTKALRDA